MAKKRNPVIRWVVAAAGLVLLYYAGTTIWGLIQVKRQKHQLQSERLHIKARTLAVEARTRALEDPQVIRMIAERRLGMRDTTHEMIQIPGPDTTAQDSSGAAADSTTEVQDTGASLD